MKTYPSDLSDAEWQLIESFFNRADNRGARSRHAKRDVVNVILYINKTGAQWRQLPKDFSPWSTVYDHYRAWSARCVWEKVLDVLNEYHRKKTQKCVTQRRRC